MINAPLTAFLFVKALFIQLFVEFIFMRQPALFALVPIIIAAATMAAPHSAAQDAIAPDIAAPRTQTPSGYPVPRFVSLRANKTYCRRGPSFQHPVAITYQRARLPLIIIAETKDHWRKIRDHDGDECWIHDAKLSGVDTALVIRNDLALRAQPDAAAPLRARLGRGVIAQAQRRDGDWVRLQIDGQRGWAHRDGLWGALAE